MAWMRYLFISLICLACTSTEMPPPIEVYAVPEKDESPPQTPAQMLAALAIVAPMDSEKGELLKDLRAILRAQDFETRNAQVEAFQEWQVALRVAEGAFAKKAFAGWLKAFVQKRNLNVGAEELARIVLAETRTGEDANFLLREKLLNPQVLGRYLEKNLSTLVREEKKRPSSGDRPASAWVTDIQQDPLYESRAREFCKAEASTRAALATQLNFPPLLQEYWQGLTLECLASLDEAAKKFENTAHALQTLRHYQAFALNALTHASVIYRRLGLREKAADMYVDMVRLWETQAIAPESFKETPVSFHLRKINDFLWCARYLALTGKNEKAEEIVRRAQEILSAGLPPSPMYNSTPLEKQAVVDYTAETYHIRASLIAFERKQYREAIAFNNSALSLPELGNTWRERLLWNSGMFSYVAEDYVGAQKYWVDLLANTKDENSKPRIYYWLAKTASILKQDDEQQKYLDALVKDFPLNYYTVVAAQLSNLLEKQWQTLFVENSDLKQKLNQGLDSDALEPIRKKRGLGRLLYRAELMIQARLQPWAKIALHEFEKGFKKEFSFAEKNLGSYVYLSRLHFANGNYVAAVSLTTEMVRLVSNFWELYPEQILIFFPTPHGTSFEKFAKAAFLKPELLYAVARQESTFRAEIKSSAGAIGMLQLMPHTARRLARQLGVKTRGIEYRLQEVDFNLQVASTYLKELNLNFVGFEPAVFSAYNAGEYPTKQWLKNRYARDPILWIELMPFAETKEYVKNVWRNLFVYRFLSSNSGNSLAFTL